MRASLLTGKHPHQTGVGVLTRPDLPHGYAGQLSPEYPTIAELLSRGGWRTWISGKWHLAADTLEANDAWPTRRGFERFFGTLAGCSSYFDPQTLTRGEAPAADANSPDFYYTDAISREAASWIDQQSAEAQIAGAQGTPYTIVWGNGAAVPLSGALPYAQFAAVIKAVQARQ